MRKRRVTRSSPRTSLPCHGSVPCRMCACHRAFSLFVPSADNHLEDFEIGGVKGEIVRPLFVFSVSDARTEKLSRTSIGHIDFTYMSFRDKKKRSNHRLPFLAGNSKCVNATRLPSRRVRARRSYEPLRRSEVTRFYGPRCGRQSTTFSFSHFATVKETNPQRFRCVSTTGFKMASQARGLQNFISDLRNAKGKVSLRCANRFI